MVVAMSDKMEAMSDKMKLDKMTMKILHEIPYIDIKPFSHNIISLELRLVSEQFGQDVANQLIEHFGLDTKGWRVHK